MLLLACKGFASEVVRAQLVVAEGLPVDLVKVPSNPVVSSLPRESLGREGPSGFRNRWLSASIDPVDNFERTTAMRGAASTPGTVWSWRFSPPLPGPQGASVMP